MGKRPRTPHFISGIGDGNVNLRGPNKFNDENKNKKYYGLKKDKATAQTSKKMRDLVMKWR